MVEVFSSSLAVAIALGFIETAEDAVKATTTLGKATEAVNIDPLKEEDKKQF